MLRGFPPDIALCVTDPLVRSRTVRGIEDCGARSREVSADLRTLGSCAGLTYDLAPWTETPRPRLMLSANGFPAIPVFIYSPRVPGRSSRRAPPCGACGSSSTNPSPKRSKSFGTTLGGYLTRLPGANSSASSGSSFLPRHRTSEPSSAERRNVSLTDRPSSPLPSGKMPQT